MNRIFLCLFVLLISMSGALAQTIEEPLLGISFNKDGMVLSGSDAGNHKGTSYNNTYAHTIYSPLRNQYLGATDYMPSGYFYVMYDADDALGKAFQKEVTWELLFRLDNPKGNNLATGAQKKLFSSQESGGWSVIHQQGVGIQLQYVTTGNAIQTISAPSDDIVTGKFYHVAVTVDRTTNLANIYINGTCVTKDAKLPSDPFIFGNFGSPRRLKNMWLSLGADPGATDAPAAGQSSARATYVYAKIYGKALSAANIAALYNREDVTYYTEPVKPQKNNDLILDAVFGKDNKAQDYSPYKAEIGVNRNPVTRYNAQQKRYEGHAEAASAFNFFYRDYFYDPSISSQLGDAFSFEVYCKEKNEFADICCPLTNQQAGGFGFEFTKTNGYPAFVCNTAGYHASAKAMASGMGVQASSVTIDEEYNHYVCVFDRKAHTAKLYMNGKVIMTKDFDKDDRLCFPYASFQWIGIMADTRANATHSNNDYPMVGDISIARVWGKALSASEVGVLNNQARSTQSAVSIPASGVATLCLPFAAVVPAGTKAYVPIRKEGPKVMLAQLAKEGETIAYGVPFILQGNAGNYTMMAADLTTAQPLVTTDNLLEGSFIAKSVDAYEVHNAGGTYTGQHNVAIDYPDNSAFLPYDGVNDVLDFVVTDSIIAQPLPPVKEDTVMTGHNMKGRITCNGAGVEGVQVSDGFEMVKTNKDGYYSFRSEKKNGYVFYTIPAGYMPDLGAHPSADERIFVPFWQSVKNDSPNVAEEHNFQLRVENNDEFLFLAGADSHLANRIDDTEQFNKGFIQRLHEEKSIADAANIPIYSTILGDNAWDTYWYGNNFTLKDYRSTLVQYGYALPFFPCMGNHDNDGATPGGKEDTDFRASWSFRANMAPNYYSYNLGQVHFVVLDDIFYLNTGSPSGTANVGSRNYKGYIPDYELEWLRKDLENVDVNTPLVIGMHIPVWMRHTSVLDSCYAYTTYTEIGANSAIDLAEVVKDYKDVRLISGHTHYNYHAHPSAYPNIHENNIAAICAIWWNSGYKTGWHNCRDGVPGGYEMFHIKGKDIKYKYHSIEHNGNAQFHVLDMNGVKSYFNEKMSGFLAKYSATNFGTWKDNMLLINVFNLDNDWKVEVVENGKTLAAQRTYVEDPYHMLTYDIPYFESGSSLSSDSRASKNTHMFKVQCQTATAPVTIRVTDSFGEVYEQVMNRPVEFSLAAIDTTTKIVTGVHSVKAPVAQGGAEIRSANGSICIETSGAATAQIVSLNGMSDIVPLTAGHNEIPVKARGIYVVKVGNMTKKVYVAH